MITAPSVVEVWLDRGELDKIIERSATQDIPRDARAYREHQDYDDDDWKRGRRRGGWLSELFD